MRKYYNRHRFAQANEKIESPLQGLDLLCAYVSAHVDEYEFLLPLQAAILARNVEEVLKLSDSISCPSRLYKDMDLYEVRVRRQVGAFLKKYPFSDEEYPCDRRAAAISKWRGAEDQCRDTNHRLRACRVNRDYPSWVFIARGLIADVLPNLEPSLLMKVLTMGKHGPGSTATNNGQRVTPYYKYADLPYSVTSSAARYAFAAIASDRHWMEILESSGRREFIPDPREPRWVSDLAIIKQCVTPVEPDVITFVPKDCRTDRPIAIGNSLNLFLQLGVNSFLTKALAQVGIDLRDQSVNQEFAKQGSRYAFLNGVENPSQFSTIDLASASDTISIEIVRLLLPSDWFRFLNDIRHKTGVLDGEEVLYEKFSAMGNGFTFPLESLIFWAVSKAAVQANGQQCKRSDIGIFGDDIIVRANSAPAVIAALNWAGFSVNTEKSFVTGSFKESCGADYFNGNDVRPFYLKRRILSHEDYYFLCNSLSHRIMDGWRDRGLYAVFTAAANLVPPSKRLYRPLEEDLNGGLQVPLATMRRLGLTPWLSPLELKDLRRAGLVSDGYKPKDKKAPDYQVPFAWRRVVSPLSFTGRGYIRMYMWLVGHGENVDSRPFYRSDLELLFDEATSAGKVTRRKAVSFNVNVGPVHNWNGAYTEFQQKAHPVNWM
nr:MAG: hypothetical protein 3 [Leviviridae sp.]